MAIKTRTVPGRAPRLFIADMLGCAALVLLAALALHLPVFV